MTILSTCISEAYSEQNSLVASSPFTEEVHREHTNPSTSGELPSYKIRRRWDICSNRFGFKRNHLEGDPK